MKIEHCVTSVNESDLIGFGKDRAECNKFLPNPQSPHGRRGFVRMFPNGSIIYKL